MKEITNPSEDFNRDGVIIYVDGACQGNGNVGASNIGGWGAILTFNNGEIVELHGAYHPTTNNRMELMAAIKALTLLEVPRNVNIYSDSKYVITGITKWIVSWKAKNWCHRRKHPIKNIDLWKELDALNSRHNVNWVWVKGHSGNAGNERADELANLGITEYKERNSLLSVHQEFHIS